ncbi:hypothetical protein [Streptomyces yangpuensis]|uniref:hypothetical protein n=1 Tax=Streptomyces yangpuensis TaxID=1648182 RepID=UPI0035D67BE1
MEIGEPAEQKGYFDSAGRQAAVLSSLPLLGTYFSRGFREKLREPDGGIARSGEASQPEGLEQALAGLRLRAALAAGNKLAEILEPVRDRPNFRYTVERRESVGSLSGKLDVTRWLARKREIQVPESYPVLRVERSSRTPENLLAAYSLLWMILEVEESYAGSAAPTNSREGKAVADLLERLEHLMMSANLADHRAELSIIGTQEWAWEVLEEVESRISAGRVGGREAYESLINWIRRTMSSTPALEYGDAEWLFYDSSFDSTLFELWCLVMLGDTISEALGQERQVPDMRTSSQVPSYRWISAGSEITIRFQYNLSNTASGGKVAWQRKGSKLGGRPDLTAVVRPAESAGAVEHSSSVVYIDPKLRKRDRVPTEEIYKMLGYFLNSGAGLAGLGVILFYTPHITPQPVYEFTSEEGGRVLAIGLDPERPDENKAGLMSLAGLILQQAELP